MRAFPSSNSTERQVTMYQIPTHQTDQQVSIIHVEGMGRDLQIQYDTENDCYIVWLQKNQEPYDCIMMVINAADFQPLKDHLHFQPDAVGS